MNEQELKEVLGVGVYDEPDGHAESSPPPPLSHKQGCDAGFGFCGARCTCEAPELRFEPIRVLAVGGGYFQGTPARAKVPGGWLVNVGVTMVFYPDPKHEWEAGTPSKKDPFGYGP